MSVEEEAKKEVKRISKKLGLDVYNELEEIEMKLQNIHDFLPKKVKVISKLKND